MKKSKTITSYIKEIYITLSEKAKDNAEGSVRNSELNPKDHHEVVENIAVPSPSTVAVSSYEDQNSVYASEPLVFSNTEASSSQDEAQRKDKNIEMNTKDFHLKMKYITMPSSTV